ncbi:NAD kinase [Rivibacter subsaxonicus]|uniref:NAD kinase n=1 Tax=Rivibacter subsaxonicus TaxID=457575 RepID=A0A4Q7VZL4_9BURK|nr:NAD kinase [Rivibacter subsaxonicus]RZU02153.1 NAD+ kinase [Rivibacter subsaxonicus]
MTSRFRHAALVGKYQAPGSRSVISEVAAFLQAQGLEVSLDRETGLNTGLTEPALLSIDEIGERCDLVVVVGGDGTMLAVARQLARHGLPLVGVNQGRLGFITDIPLTDLHQTLAPMIAGDYEEEQRSLLAGRITRGSAATTGHTDTIHEGFAVNDVVITRGATAGMVELRVQVQDQFVANFRADGLIIASPTGSTAYALSAGGPILHPGISGWVMAPIAPHSLSNRPIVLPDAGEVIVEIAAGRDASVNFDHQSLASLQIGDRIHVRRSEHRVRFLHPRGWSYYATLRRKLHWNEGVVV